MPRSKDPFADANLSEQVGLDQRLFSPSSTPAKPKEGPSRRKDVGTKGPSDERTKERTTGHPSGRTKGRTSGGSRQYRTAGQLRRVEHRPYDFFADQVRWLNRQKLEIEERYGRRVPATAMVQLAVDLLIADFEANGEQSNLIRVLVKDEQLGSTGQEREEAGGRG